MPTTNGTTAHDLHRFFLEQAISDDASIVAAFSGGADSLALLVLLKATVHKDRLVAVYVNHRLRDDGELKREEQLNRSNCDALGIPLRIVRLAPHQVHNLAKERGNGIEEAARVLRYTALERIREELGYSYIATAHTADDQAETMLMRLLQGAGPSALQGIAARKGTLVRPMLSMTRSQVIETVRAAGLSWSEDSTNSDTDFLRNKIRHELIPVIGRLFPQYRESLDAIARQSKRYGEVLEPMVEAAYAQAVAATDEGVTLQVGQVKHLPAAVIEQLCYRCWDVLQQDSGKRLPHRVVEDLTGRIATGWPSERAMDVSGTVVTVKAGVLTWKLRERTLAAAYASLVYSDRTPLDGLRYLLRGGTPESPVPVQLRARIDESLLSGPVVARSALASDRIELAEGTKKVSALYASWRIRPEMRWRIPVLEDGKGIFAVLGGSFGGKDRVARRCLSATLARNDGTLYSVTDIEG